MNFYGAKQLQYGNESNGPQTETLTYNLLGSLAMQHIGIRCLCSDEKSMFCTICCLKLPYYVLGGRWASSPPFELADDKVHFIF